jgi:hypothetical protein
MGPAAVVSSQQPRCPEGPTQREPYHSSRDRAASNSQHRHFDTESAQRLIAIASRMGVRSNEGQAKSYSAQVRMLNSPSSPVSVSNVLRRTS